MPWRTEDWEPWYDHGAPDSERRLPAGALREILINIPDRHEKSLVDFGCGAGDDLPVLAAGFQRVLAVDADAALLDRLRSRAEGSGIRFQRCEPDAVAALDGGFDVALAVDRARSQRHGASRPPLRAIRDSLVEGGILLATFPATPRAGRPYALALGREPDPDDRKAVHEVELQYRLRAAGYRGLRIRRLRGFDEDSDLLLTMAVRRADN